MSDTFAIDLSKFCALAKGNADQVVRKVAIDVTKNVVIKTPVDTGRARANWNVQIDQPDYTTTAETDTSGDGTVGKAVSTLQDYRAGPAIWITNGLPYISTLEYGGYPNPPKNDSGKTSGGYSIQAPAGMVRITVAEYQRFVDQAVKGLVQ